MKKEIPFLTVFERTLGVLESQKLGGILLTNCTYFALC